MNAERKQELLSACKGLPEPQLNIGQIVWLAPRQGYLRQSTIESVLLLPIKNQKWYYTVVGEKDMYSDKSLFTTKEELISYLES